LVGGMARGERQRLAVGGGGLPARRRGEDGRLEREFGGGVRGGERQCARVGWRRGRIGPGVAGGRAKGGWGGRVALGAVASFLFEAREPRSGGETSAARTGSGGKPGGPG